MAIKVIFPGFLTTIQDLGRTGYGRFGVPMSGPMDRFAFCAANQLAGNPWNTPALEIGIDGPLLEFDRSCLVAVTGEGFSLQVQGQPQALWTCLQMRAGSSLQITRQGSGTWAYLAVQGGIQAESLLGSHATYLKGGFGGLNGRPLQSEDVLETASNPVEFPAQAGSLLPAHLRPRYRENPMLEVVLGPQEERFTEEGMHTFLGCTYLLSSTSDRMGYRLEGEKISHRAGADILSDGMLFGSVQVPASGQPIIMMSEAASTGGYTKIATLVSADQPILAQVMPGMGQVRFKTTTPHAAQHRLRALFNGLKNGVQMPADDDEMMAYI